MSGTADVAIVTGAGRGLGASIAHRLAATYHVVVAEIDGDAGTATTAEIVANGGRPGGIYPLD